MPRIPEEIIERILRDTSIVDLVGAYLQLRRAGSSFVALCPFHQEKTPSFNVNPAQQRFHCFGCGESGDAARFLMLQEGIDFPTALRRLAARSGIVIPEQEEDPAAQSRRKLRDRLRRINSNAADWFHVQLMRTPETGAAARAYLKERGFSQETARRWKLGYAPGPSQIFLRWARESGHAEEILEAAGLVARRDTPGRNLYCRFRDRLMFPVWDDSGNIAGFSGRILGADPRAAKYLNTPETLLFTKGHILFGLHQSRRSILRAGRAIVCEGQLDLIRMFEEGIENVVAPLGTAFTSAHARLLTRITQEALLCFDADPAGYQAALRTYRELVQTGIRVRALRLPPGEDPDSLIASQGPEAFRALLDQAPEFLDFQLALESTQRDLSLPREHRAAVAALSESLALIPDPILLDSEVLRLSTRLHVAPMDLLEEVRKIRSRPRPRDSAEAAAEPGTAAFRQAPSPLETAHPRLRQLCLLALTRAHAKAALLEQGERLALISEYPGGELVLQVIQGAFDPEDPASRSRFLAGLDPVAEKGLSALANLAPGGDGRAAAHELLTSLEEERSQRHLQALAAALAAPGLSLDEAIRIQKEILDLQSGRKDSSAATGHNPSS
ncbi:MAG TPA: DNA primase [Verrucomicrobiales bacterium]|nr:DNA primase [Verrucomicrobiales bacterium]